MAQIKRETKNMRTVNEQGSHFISQEAQLCEEVLRHLDFIPDRAFLHLQPHGLSLLTNGLLHQEIAFRKKIQITRKK